MDMIKETLEQKADGRKMAKGFDDFKKGLEKT